MAHCDAWQLLGDLRCGVRLAGALLAAWTAVAPIPASVFAGEKYALVVGVENYRETELSTLDFAADDADKLGVALEQLGFDVITMTSGATRVNLEPATPADILESLDRRLKFRDRDDTVVVSLSGHGVQLVGDPAGPDGTRETWFCPSRARVADRTTLLAISEVIRRMAACPAARKLLLVDACRNDMTPAGAGKAREVIEIELDPAAPARRTIPDGMVALFSCSSKERSFERKDLGHSLFSYHVIQYLAGAADDPVRWYDGGEARLTDLVAYAQKRTARSAEDLGADQTPELVGRMTDWSFGRVPGNGAGEVITNSIGMRLVRIDAGEFEMGRRDWKPLSAGEDDDEGPVHRVRITKPFVIGQTEVTQAQFQKVMGRAPWKGQEYVKEGENIAATYISWADAVGFCRRLTEVEQRAGRLSAGRSYRLPTEAEWEYACRAGTDTTFSFGDDWALLDLHGWTNGSLPQQDGIHAREVGKKKANPWNLHDMHGNVEEWCSDWYARDYYSRSPLNDPKGPDGGEEHVRRGGSAYVPSHCDSFSRGCESCGFPPCWDGFRVVCELD